MRVLTVLAATLLLSTGCLGDGDSSDGVEYSLGDWQVVDCGEVPASDPGTRPDLVLHDGDAVRLFTWTGNAYDDTAQGPTGTRHAATVGNTTYTAMRGAPHQVLALDEDLKQLASAPFDAPVTALAGGNGILWVASNWTLYALDADLHEVGRVETPPPHDRGAGKEVDHIVVAGGRAHLLDDIVVPFWSFLVDVADPAAMTLLETVQTGGSSSPAWQWVDPGRSWWIQTNFAGSIGGSTGADRFDLTGGGAKEVGRVGISGYSSGVHSDGQKRASGFSVLASTAVAPVWAVLSAQGEAQFRNVLMEDAPTMACGAPLDMPLKPGSVPTRTTLVQRDGLVVGTVGDQLLAWAVDGEPVLVHEQALPFVPVHVALR